jgi:hypothetical protein
VKTGCPFCGGKRLSVTNSLVAVAPKLVKEWNFDRNGSLQPKDIRANATRRVHWTCPNGPDHKWKAAVGRPERFWASVVLFAPISGYQLPIAWPRSTRKSPLNGIRRSMGS